MEYKIIIEDKTNQQSSPIAGQDAQTIENTKTSSDSFKIKDFTPYVAYRQAKPFISQFVSNEVQKVGLRTGSSRLQEKANFYHSILSKTVSFGESVAIGAMTGGVAGAIIGGVLSTAHTLITISNNQERININHALENESIKMTNIRAGSQGSRRA